MFSPGKTGQSKGEETVLSWFSVPGWQTAILEKEQDTVLTVNVAGGRKRREVCNTVDVQYLLQALPENYCFALKQAKQILHSL